MRPALLVLAAVVLALPAVHAAITWTASTTLTTTVTPPPITFQLGDSATNLRHVGTLEVSPNGTSLTGSVKARAGAQIQLQDLARIHNQGPTNITVTLTGSHESNAHLTTATWTLRNETTTLTVLDHKAATPTTTLVLPPSTTYYLDIQLELAEGAGHNNATLNFQLGTTVG